jgi:thioredoxin-dependent peroxiredoxin
MQGYSMSETVLTPSDSAPDFTLLRDGGESVTLSALMPQKVVLYFYPRDDTLGCTIEALDFTALAHEFAKANTVIFGISKDPIKAHDKFVKKHNLNISLLSDYENNICESYGTWVEKSMYGKIYSGIERATFLIGSDGRILQIWRKVSVKGHAEAVLAATKAAI